MKRFRQLDMLRALAVTLVLGRHMIPCPEDTSVLLNRITAIWLQGGWVGVDLFFVLSGFLVSGLLFREYEKSSRLDIKRFLIRRAFKIYPPFWVLIAVTIISIVLRNKHFSWQALLCELLFVQNYGTFMWPHTWSLAVEEHFYLLLALTLFLLTRRSSVRPFKAVPFAFLGVAALCLLLRIIHARDRVFDGTHLFPSHLRLDALLFGVVLSYYFRQSPLKFMRFAQRYRVLLAMVGALLLMPAFAFPLERTPFIYTYGLTLFYLGGGCFVVAALGSAAPEGRFASSVAYIGSHSYSVYLWHMPVVGGAALVWKMLPGHINWGIYCVLCLAGAIIFGIGMALAIESPVLRLRDRMFPSRGTPLGMDPTGPSGVSQQTDSVATTRQPGVESAPIERTGNQ